MLSLKENMKLCQENQQSLLLSCNYTMLNYYNGIRYYRLFISHFQYLNQSTFD